MNKVPEIACFILARDLMQPMNGRKLVIKGAITAAIRRYDSVKVFIVGRGVDRDYCIDGCDVKEFHLGYPSVLEVMFNVVFYCFFKGWSLNEAFFYSRRLRERILNNCQGDNVAFVYSDMVRCASYANSLSSGSFHVDLDDLLSRRYMKFFLEGFEGFGYAKDRFSGWFGGMLLKLIGALARPIFLIESILIKNREIRWAREAKTVSLVSQDEAIALSKMIGKDVIDIAMCVDQPPYQWRRHLLERELIRACFVGSLDVPGNRLTLEWYMRFLCENSSPFNLTIIGSTSDQLQREFNHPSIRFLGYVDDLYNEINSADLFFAPIFGGTGIKTKIVEAMAAGIPILTTKDGLSGLSLESELVGIFDPDSFDIVRFLAQYEARIFPRFF